MEHGPSEAAAITNRKNPIVLNSTMSSPRPPPPQLPPLPLPPTPDDANPIADGTQPPAARETHDERQTNTPSSGDGLMAVSPKTAIGRQPQTGKDGDTPGAADGSAPFSDSVRTLGDAGAVAPAVLGAQATADNIDDFGSFDSFPAEAPSANTRFICFDSALHEKGYDSEGEQVHYDPISLDDDPDELMEVVIQSTPPPPPAAAPAQVEEPPQLTIEDVRQMKNMTIIKGELAKRGLSKTGGRGVLEERLIQAIRDNLPVAPGAPKRDDCLRGVDVSAYWEVQVPNPTPIPQPVNEDPTLRPPTERDQPINPKYGYDEVFARIPFEGTTEKQEYTIFQSPRKKSKKRKFTPTKKGSKPTFKPKKRTRGGPNSDFLKKHALDEHSHPMDWFNALLPMTPKDNLEDAAKANVKGDRTTKFSVSSWAAYTNSKAKLVNAGGKGQIFEGRWKDLEPEDVMQMMGVYIIDGLAPSPRLVQKMQPQAKQRTHGNDFIARCIGPMYEQKYRNFRHFFGCQDPLKIPPAKEKCPNVKVDELFRWCRYIWKQAWVLGENFSTDEQTCKMQGKSEYKTRCGKFKRLGDGLQTDAIADDGYTYDFYFRNEPVPQKWLDAGFCAMHARLLHMFENLPDVGHQCKMDNLFVSVLLARAAYSLPSKVKIHGVIRKSGRGVPPAVLQEDLGTGRRADAARGTTKMAVLRDDSKSDGLVVASCYDQKPFYMLSHSIEKVTWVEVMKMVWSTKLGRNVPYRFLRWILSHDYNFEMNDNDVADQLRLVYRLMRMQRNQKWWWSLWMWAIEVSLVNSYMMMRRYCELKGVPMPWKHHDFNEAVGYALISPESDWPRRKGPPEISSQKKRKRSPTAAEQTGGGEEGPTIPLECSLSEQRVAQVPSRRDAKPHADRTVGEAGQSGLSAS